MPKQSKGTQKERKEHMIKDRVLVPPVKIQGIKTKMVPFIRESVCINEDTTWIEPFMGSGVVGFNIMPERAVFADINPHIIKFYNCIKERKITSSLVRSFLEEQGSLLESREDAYYYEVRERFNMTHDPLDFLFLNRSCFNGMIRFNRAFAFNVPFGHKPQRFSKAYITKIVNQVACIEELLASHEWIFLCQSFEKTISMAEGNSFIYCDPPYIGRHVDYYDSWDEQSEFALCESLKATDAMFMLSTWDHNEYRKNTYIDMVWNSCYKLTKDHYYHVGAKEANRKPVMEALLMNYIPAGDGNRLPAAPCP